MDEDELAAFEAEFRDWMTYPGDLSEDTQDTYMGMLRPAARDGLDLADLDPEDAQAYVASRHTDLSKRSLNVLISALNKALEYQKKARELGTVTTPPPSLRPLTDDQLAQVLAYRSPIESLSRTLRAMLQFTAYTGMRIGEVWEARLSDPMPTSYRVRVSHPLKGGWVRPIRVDPNLFHPRRPFMAYLRWRREVDPEDDDTPSDALWLIEHGQGPRRRPAKATVKKWSQKVAEQTGVSVQWHRLRHTLGRKWVQSNKPLARLGYVLGHQDEESTLRYARLLPGDQDELWERTGGVGDFYQGGEDR